MNGYKKTCVLLCAVGFMPLNALAQQKLIPSVKKIVQQTSSKQMADVAFRQALFKKAVESRAVRAAADPVIIPTASKDLMPVTYCFNEQQAKELFAQYYQAMEHFAAFKRDFAPRLFYMQTQRDVLPSAEKAYFNQRILKLEEEFVHIGLFFNGDEPLAAARRYLTKARLALNPYSKATIPVVPDFLHRTDRKLVAAEFFLHHPDGSAPIFKRSWLGAWKHSQKARELGREIPPGMRIALVNDQPLQHEAVHSWNKKGFFPPGTQIISFLGVPEFEQAYAGGARFDLIITDLVMPNGGGYSLIFKLRQQDVSTPVIAWTGFSERDQLAQELYNFGFDGMIPARGSVFSFTGPEGYLPFIESLRNYFLLKKLNGWKR